MTVATREEKIAIVWEDYERMYNAYCEAEKACTKARKAYERVLNEARDD